MANELTEFYAGETKIFRLQIDINGSNPNITGDIVKIVLKDSPDDDDVDAVLNENGDVTTYGATGTVEFTLTDDVTAITPKVYHYGIQWYTGDDKYVLLDKKIKVKQRTIKN